MKGDLLNYEELNQGQKAQAWREFLRVRLEPRNWWYQVENGRVVDVFKPDTQPRQPVTVSEPVQLSWC